MISLTSKFVDIKANELKQEIFALQFLLSQNSNLQVKTFNKARKIMYMHVYVELDAVKFSQI